MVEKTWIFDFDDTLAWNFHHYELAKLKFAEWIINTIGGKAPGINDLLDIQTKMDLEGVLTKGFGRERFPTSMSSTYEFLCNKLGIPISKELSKEAYKIGETAFFTAEEYGLMGLVGGAEEVLDFLLEKGDELIIYTKGDVEIQNRKIEGNNLDKWFNETIITNDKSSDEIKSIISGKNPDSVLMVGNSVRSDMIPAQEAGLRTVYVPCETWAYEREHNGFEEGLRATKINEISEIIREYDYLTRPL